MDINQVTNKPRDTIRIPPGNSHFQAIKTNTRSPSQGAAFGLFFIMPIRPPPYSSEPDSNAKTNKRIPIVNMVYLAIFRRIFAVFT